jgi:predicted lysophospholipase L1 biosynthesis ABC-type transport system permease subunit
VTIVNSIDLTVLTIYGYTRSFTPVIPQAGRLRVDDQSQKVLRGLPETGRMIETSGFFFNVNTVFGKAPFICFGVAEEDRVLLMKRSGDYLAEGRMPTPGEPEAVVSEGLVRNRRLKLGDVVASPEDTGSLGSVPMPVKLVGILKGPTWLAFTSKEFSDAALPLYPHSLLVTTKPGVDQVAYGNRLYKKLDRVKVRVFSFQELVKELRESLESIYLIMAMVNGTVIFVVALMSGMLSNIYFTQRIHEFAILAAIGLRRTTLVLHAVSETAILSSVAWIGGILVTWAAMNLMRGRIFEPRGMLINPMDLFAYSYTIPIPLFITLFAIGTVGFRLAQLDPVTIIERR